MNSNCYVALAVAVMSVFVALLVPTSNAMGICFGGGYPNCCQGGRNTVQGDPIGCRTGNGGKLNNS